MSTPYTENSKKTTSYFKKRRKSLTRLPFWRFPHLTLFFYTQKSCVFKRARVCDRVHFQISSLHRIKGHGRATVSKEFLDRAASSCGEICGVEKRPYLEMQQKSPHDIRTPSCHHVSWQMAGSPFFFWLQAASQGWISKISKRTAGSPVQHGKSLAQHCSEPLALSPEHARIDAAPCRGDPR